MNQKIRIKLRSYDHNLVDKSTEKIVKESSSSFGRTNAWLKSIRQHKRQLTHCRSWNSQVE